MNVDFIDTNVFIYLFDETAPDKQSTAEKIINNAIKMKDSIISFQVVQETLNVLTTKISSTVELEDAKIFFSSVLNPLWKINPSYKLYQRTLDIQSRYKYGFLDSLILSSAIEGGCTHIFSEDMQNGQEIDTVKIKNPFI